MVVVPECRLRIAPRCRPPGRYHSPTAIPTVVIVVTMPAVVDDRPHETTRRDGTCDEAFGNGAKERHTSPSKSGKAAEEAAHFSVEGLRRLQVGLMTEAAKHHKL